MMETLMSIFGVTGAALCIAAYALIERGKLNPHGFNYYFLNGLGAFLVLVAAFWSYDSGDLGAIVQELCWVAVSLMGILKVLKKGAQ
jgi:hypothetical protein